MAKRYEDFNLHYTGWMCLRLLPYRYYRPHRSCGKVMFLHLSVILSTGGVCQTPPTSGTHLLDRHPLGRQPPGQTSPQDTAVDGTHLTGMHSCYTRFSYTLFVAPAEST